LLIAENAAMHYFISIEKYICKFQFSATRFKLCTYCVKNNFVLKVRIVEVCLVLWQKAGSQSSWAE